MTRSASDPAPCLSVFHQDWITWVFWWPRLPCQASLCEAGISGVLEYIWYIYDTYITNELELSLHSYCIIVFGLIDLHPNFPISVFSDPFVRRNSSHIFYGNWEADDYWVNGESKQGKRLLIRLILHYIYRCLVISYFWYTELDTSRYLFH